MADQNDPQYAGQQRVQQMLQAGAPQDQVMQWQQQRMSDMVKSGAPPDQVYKYWNGPTPDNTRIDRTAAGNVNAATKDPGYHPDEATNPYTAFLAGLQVSSSGLALRGELPSKVVSENAPLYMRLSSAFGETLGDLPATVVGMFSGAAVGATIPGGGETGVPELAGGGAGAFATPETLRETLIDYYQHRDGKFWNDFWSRYATISSNTLKSAGLGAFLGPFGGAVDKTVLNATGNKFLSTSANLGAQTIAATTIGTAMQGKMPNRDDFIINAVQILGFHAAGTVVSGMKGESHLEINDSAKHVAENLMAIYAKTGMTPQDAIARANKDPAFKSELLAPKSADGSFAARQYFGLKEPDPEPFTKPKINAHTIQEEHSDEVMRLQTEAKLNADYATNMVAPETMRLVRNLESSGDDAVSKTGAIGRFQIEPGTAKQYGFDPAQLHDPVYNEKVASVVLKDLSRQFKGNMTDMLVAYNAGPGRARSWIASGRVFSELPLETQRYLEHAERLGGIKGGLNTKDSFADQQTNNMLNVTGDHDTYLPPDGTAVQGIKPDAKWLFTGKFKDDLVTRLAPNGDVTPAPEAVASYLQKVGARAGFKFQVGPEMEFATDKPALAEDPRDTKNVPQQQSIREYSTDEIRSQVYMPSNPDEINRRWLGLGMSEVMFHELGHAIDKNVLGYSKEHQMMGTRYIPAGPLKDEMIAASKNFRPKLWTVQPKYNMTANELMADSIASWLSDPTARAKMPLFAKQFGKKLAPYLGYVDGALPKRIGEDDDGNAKWTWPDHNDTSDEPASWEPITEDWANPEDNGKGGGGKPPGEPPKRPKYEPPEKPKKITDQTLKMSKDNMRDKILDMVAPEVKSGLVPDWMNPRKWIAQFQAALTPARNIDEKLDLDKNQLGIEDLLRQTYASKERSSYFIRIGTLDPTLKDNEVVQTSDDNFMKAYALVKEDGGDTAGFTAYRLARRAIELKDRGITMAGEFDADFARRYLAKKWPNGKSDDSMYKRGLEVMQRVKDASVDYATNSGLFSPRQGDAIKDLNREHVVLMRIMDPAYNPNVGKGFGVGTPVRKIKGSDRQIVDPTTAEVDNLHRIIAMADRNRAVGNIIGLVEQKNAEANKAGLPAILPMEKVWKDEEIPRVGELLDENGKPIPEPAKPGAEPFLAYKRAMGKLGPDDFIYFRNGNAEVWRVKDPDLAAIIRTTTPGQRNPIVQFLTKFAGLARAGITGSLDYPFRAITHGQLASAVAAQEGTAPFTDVARGFFEVLNKGEAYRAWQRNGGAATALSDIDRDYIQKDIDALFDKTDTTFSVWNTFKHPIDTMRVFQHQVDAMARVGYTQRLTEKGYSPMKAATMARTAYLDNMEGFSGQWVNTWSHMVPFMPIGFKDIEQVGAAMKRNAPTFLTRASLILTLPTAMNFIANYYADKKLPVGQRYSDLPRWERDMYWVLPPVNGVRVKIKRPYTMGYLFATLPERFMEHTMTDDPRSFEEWGQSLIAQYMPPTMPVGIQPVAEQIANKSFFTQRPLIKASLEKTSGYMQYGPDTSETAKAIARVLGPPGMNAADVSPIVIQNYAREWTGSLPMTILRVLEMPFKQPGPPMQVADLPFVGSFIARNPGAGAQPIIDFYNEYDKFTTAHADLRLALERNDTSEIKDAIQYQAFVNFSQLRKALHEQQAVVQAIDENPKMTRAEKLKWTDSLYGGMVKEAQTGLTMIDKLKANESGNP